MALCCSSGSQCLACCCSASPGKVRGFLNSLAQLPALDEDTACSSDCCFFSTVDWGPSATLSLWDARHVQHTVMASWGTSSLPQALAAAPFLLQGWRHGQLPLPSSPRALEALQKGSFCSLCWVSSPQPLGLLHHSCQQPHPCPFGCCLYPLPQSHPGLQTSQPGLRVAGPQPRPSPFHVNEGIENPFFPLASPFPQGRAARLHPWGLSEFTGTVSSPG